MKSIELERSKTSKDERPVEDLKLKDVVRNVLEESRMVLPGIQALFGFQLIAVFNARFDQLSAVDKNLHMASILLTIIAIAFLMAPAAYHRQVERNTVSQTFVDYSSKLLCMGMIPLMLSMSLDAFVVSNIVLRSDIVAGVISGACFLLLFGMWYIVPYCAVQRYKRFP